jgi:hypothetical protein
MRLSDVLKGFVSVIAAVGPKVAKAVVEAIVGCIGKPKPGTERTIKGVTFVDRPVDQDKLSIDLVDALRAEGLHADGRELMRALAAETRKRGKVWENQCLALTLEEHVIAPLRKHGKAKEAAA